jgi:hypothetical protein
MLRIIKLAGGGHGNWIGSIRSKAPISLHHVSVDRVEIRRETAALSGGGRLARYRRGTGKVRSPIDSSGGETQVFLHKGDILEHTLIFGPTLIQC